MKRSRGKVGKVGTLVALLFLFVASAAVVYGLLVQYHRGYLTGLTDGAAVQLETDAKRIGALEELVAHMWVHDGYERNGYGQMTTPQKLMYDEITTRDPE